MFNTKYKPTTQKALFHKDVVNHIRKWIKMLEDSCDRKSSMKHILFVHGSISCGKTVTIECLFKAFNLITVDSDNLRSSDRISEVLQTVVGFNDITLANIDKWNHKTRKDKPNIVFIDNIELCEKGIDSFVDMIHNRLDRDVPIILISNNAKHQDIFTNYQNCTFVQFKKPSLLELTKLASDINQAESLELTRPQTKQIVERCQYDIRQLLFLLEQWMLSKRGGSDFDMFLETVQLKQVDQDIGEKMSVLCNRSAFNFRSTFGLAASEPHILSSSIYQNYITVHKVPESTEPKIIASLLQNYSNVMDNISMSDVYNNEIYENQQWGLYNEYAVFSTVLPSYYLKQNAELLQSTTTNEFVTYKDISYNFINSYEEVKRVCETNVYNKHLSNGVPDRNVADTIRDRESLFKITAVLIECIRDLNEYFDQNKRGKNTTKREKFDLCNNITEQKYKTALDLLVNTIYNYRLFEVDIEQVLVNITDYQNDDTLKQNVNKIDLRVFKRLLNIFTFDDSHKLFKSNVEISVQYKIFQMLVKNLHVEKRRVPNTIESLTQDLDTIWNL